MSPFLLELRPEVERDIENALAWYAQRDLRLGARFLAEVDEAYRRILENPAQFPIVHKDVRRVLFARFPFAVYYAVTAQNVDVIAVMNLRQHPDTWRLPER